MSEEDVTDDVDVKIINKVAIIIAKTLQINQVPKNYGLSAMMMVILEELDAFPDKKCAYRDFAKIFIEKMNECQDET